MKKIAGLLAIIVLIFFCINTASAQNISSEIYSLVKIHLQAGVQEKLQREGVYFDEGEILPGKYFTGAFNSWELAQIRSLNIQYDLLEDDMTEAFLQRNAVDMEQHPDPIAEARLQPSVNCNYAVPLLFQLGSMGGYLTYEEMLAALDTMHARFPNLCSAKIPVSTTQKTWEDRPLYYVKISDHVNKDEPGNPKFYIQDCTMHVKE